MPAGIALAMQAGMAVLVAGAVVAIAVRKDGPRIALGLGILMSLAISPYG